MHHTNAEEASLHKLGKLRDKLAGTAREVELMLAIGDKEKLAVLYEEFGITN